MEGHHPQLPRKKKDVQDNSFHWKGHGHRLLGHWWSYSSGCDGQRWDSQFGRVHQNPPKPQNSVTGDCGLAGIQKTCWLSTTMSHKSTNPGGNRQIWLECAPPFPFCPDLAPSGFHLFGQLKDALRGTRFEDDESVIHAVRTWLSEQETSWYREGMHALVSRWRRAVDVDGDYVKKITRVK